MAKNRALFGIYENSADIAHALGLLQAAGFRSTDISVLWSENARNQDPGVTKSTKAPEGAVAGAGSGAILGGALGWLAGIGALAIPGAGPLIAAGPLLALLGGAGVGGAVGGVAGGLIGAGIPEFEARRYAAGIHKGHVLLSIHCDDEGRESAAKDILRRSGAEDISITSQAADGFDSSGRSHERRETARDFAPDFRENFANFHGDLGPFEQFAPLYDWGYEMARDPRYRDETFEKAEPDLKSVFELMNPGTDWNRISALVLYGWEKAGGKIENRFAII